MNSSSKENAKQSALESKLHKTHTSREYCRHCGVETSRSVRHESGHREYDHDRSSLGKMIER